MKTKTTSTIEESAIVERVARIVSSVRGSKPDYTRLAEELEQAIPFDIFGVVLLRHDREALRIVVCQRDLASWQASSHQHPYNGSMFEQVLREPDLRVKEYSAHLDGPPAQCGDALSGNHQLCSTVIAPLVVEDRVLGTLELGSTVAGMYQDETLQRLIKAVAHVLASAIESAQRGGSAEIQDRQREALKDVSSALTSEVELNAILQQIVEGIAKALQVAAAVILVNQREGLLSLEVQSGLTQSTARDLFAECWPLREHCLIGESLLRQQPLVSQDILLDERYFLRRPLFSALTMRSVYCYPLVMGNAVYGALLLCSPEPGGFSPLKTDIFALFAGQANVAIHNCMLLEAAQQRRRFQDAIARLEQAHQRIRSEAPERHKDGELETQTAQSMLEADYALLHSLQVETQQTFGVSFGSLLRFISDHLLTQSERDLHTLLQSDQTPPFERSFLRTTQPELAVAHAIDLEGQTSPAPSAVERRDTLSRTVTLLSQTAEAALLSADMLSELSRLLLQLQHTTTVKSAWFVVDLQGKCVYMNPMAETLCGVSLENIALSYDSSLFSTVSNREQAVKIENVFARLLPRLRNASEVQHFLHDLSQGAQYRQILSTALAQEASRPHTTGFIARSTTTRQEGNPSDYHYQFRRYPLYNQQGSLLAHALQVQDITEQVRDEKNRSTLLSAVSHDLRTPLTTIKAAVTGLLQPDVLWSEQDQREMLEDIDSETDHLTILVNALVEMSRIEMGALSLEKEWCDILEVLHRTVLKMGRVLNGVSVQMDVRSPLPLVYGDHVQLERAFFHVLENAARHSPLHAAITVQVEVTGHSSGEKQLSVRVIDRGETLSPEKRDRLFTSYNGQAYGSGLGLAICKGIIEAHQGRISVEVPEGGGTCFTFILPAHPYTLTLPEEGSAARAASAKRERRTEWVKEASVDIGEKWV